MDLEVKFDGLDRLLTDLRRFGAAAEPELERAIEDTAQNALRVIQQATPVATGFTKRDWSVKADGKLRRVVYTNNPIAWFLEWGTGLHSEAPGAKRQKYKIEPKAKKALAFQGKGGSPYQLREGGKPVTDAKGRAVYRSKAGNGTVNKANAASMVVRRYVMHPGIKPVAMVRGSLPILRAYFLQRVGEAADRILANFSRGT